ncbi:MAG: PKD domain-containing protein [Carboxylicivirga sp.]|jgi:hypothetical protein|nr:PKD domain-containing protein [Carboxylicivirga sp.]
MKRINYIVLMMAFFAMCTSACEKDTSPETQQTENKAPTANAGDDQTVTAGDLVKLTADASSDPEKQELTYVWSAASNNPAGVELSDKKVVNPTFTAPATAGDYTFSLVVSDGELNSKADQVTVSVQAAAPSNNKPVANAGDDQTVDAGSLVTLDASASSDADQDQLSYKWTVDTSNPESVTLSAVDAAQPTFTAPGTAGIYTFSLIVNDGSEDSEADKVVITVNAVSQTQTITFAGVSRTDALLKSVAFGNNTFVAVGHYGNSAKDEDRGTINYSTDGENWHEVSNMTGGDSWHEVIFANNRFVATGDYGAIATSADGQSWTKTTTAEQRHWYSVVYYSGTYVFTSKSGRYGIAKKDDFSDLVIDKSNYTDDVWYSVSHGNNKYVMVGNNGRVGYSADGDNWEFKTIDKSGYRRFIEVSYGKAGFVATVSQGSTTMAISADGENWTLKSNSVALQGGKFLNDTYLMLGKHLTDDKIFITEDLNFDTAKSFDADGNWLDVTYGNNKYVIVGSRVAIIQ